jgi:hypothetical protein
MDSKLKQPLLWVVGVLLALPLAAAALPEILQPIIDVFGTGGIAGIYQVAPLLWDSIIALVIFLSLTQHILGARLGKGVSVAIGLVLAIAFSVFELQSGFTFADVAPIAGLAVIALLVYAIYGFFAEIFHSKIAGFAFAFLLGWFAMNAISGAYYKQHAPTVYSILSLVAALALIAIIWFIISWVIGFAKGRSSESGGGSSGGGGGESGEGWWAKRKRLREEKKAGKEKEKEDLKQKNAQTAVQVLKDRVENQLQIELNNLGNATTNAEALLQSVTATTTFAETVDRSINDQLDSKKKAPFDPAVYQQQIAGERATLQQYLTQQRDLAQAIQQEGMQQAQAQQGAAGVTDQQLITMLQQLQEDDVVQFGEERNFIQELEAHERLLTAKAQNLQPSPTPSPADPYVVHVHQNYTQHTAEITRLRGSYQQLSQVVQRIKDEIGQKGGTFLQSNSGIAGDLAARNSILQKEAKYFRTILSELQTYHTKLLAYIDLPDNKRFSEMKSASKDLLTSIKKLQEILQQRRQPLQDLAQRISTLEADVNAQRVLQQQFEQEMDAALAQGEEITANAIAAAALLRISRRAQQFQPNPAQAQATLVFMQRELHLLLQAPFTPTNSAHNRQQVRQGIRSDVDFVQPISDLETARNNATPGTPAHTTLTNAYNEAQQLQATLIQAWDHHFP